VPLRVDKGSNPLFQISNNGNVGIGTTGPLSALHINTGLIYAWNTPDKASYGMTSSGSLYGAIGATTKAGTGGWALGTMAAPGNSSTLTPVLSWTGDGNVGIGTTSPTAKLHVSSADNSTWATQIYNLGTTNAHGLYVNIGGLSTGVPLRVDKGSNPLFQISNNGNVGIGTTSPYGKLHINGGHLNLGGTGDPAGDQGNNWLTWGYRADNNPYYAIRTQYKTYGSYTYSRLQLNWHTGIELGAHPLYGGVRFFDNSPGVGANQIAAIGDAGYTYFNQNVGIGTTGPIAKLDVAGSIKANNHVTHLPWYNIAASFTGYLKLSTPIVHNESNMFTIKIKGYEYGHGAYPVEIRCGGYAYSASTLINTRCYTEGTDLPVEIGTETRADQGGNTVVVIRLGTPSYTSWYYSHFTAEYVGWNAKNPDDFKWVKGETTPAQTGNTNNVFIEDQSGTSYFNAGNVGIGTTGPGAKLEVAGAMRTGILQIQNDNSDVSDRPYIRGIAGSDLVINMRQAGGGTMWINYPGSLTSGTVNTRIQETLFISATGTGGNGNVGIGTTALGYKLAVQGGDIYASGVVRSGTSPVSTATCSVQGSNWGGPSTCTARCSSGTWVTGCGVSISMAHYPSGNGCYCDRNDPNGGWATCYAICRP
jgi:hypothetical protein